MSANGKADAETKINSEQAEETMNEEIPTQDAEGTQEAEGTQAEDGQKANPPPPDLRDLRIQTLERQLHERDATLHEYIRAHKKAQADMEAYRARLERDRERDLVAAKIKFVERLLDVHDNLERTVDAAKQSGESEAMVSGLEMVLNQFISRLEELGLTRHDPTGEAFDPTSMEAFGVSPVQDPAAHDTVVFTMRTGYRLGDREIRPALVHVGKYNG